MDYKNTLNLPKTDFPMKANLSMREPDIEKLWEQKDIYTKICRSRESAKKYILHDGPPYANGHIHIGHALNKTLKDIVVKYKTMRGLYSDYIPGWDCHGLPVEHQLLKKLKKRKEDIPQVEFRKKAHEYAMNFVDIQREEFKRLGVFGDWQNPYLTLSREYETGIVRSFAKLVEEGYIYKGLKPVNYCYVCETALAEAEVEYEDHTSPSIYVKFKLKETAQLSTLNPKLKNSGSIVIWTTTPWTLIANVAVAVHPQFEYVAVKTGDDVLIIVGALLEHAMEKMSIDKYEIIDRIKGAQLEGLAYDHPLGLREGKVVLADYVSMEDGTGCVHTAPGHGQEDYQTGLKYGLEVIMPVDEKGRFVKGVPGFAGMNVHKADSAIVEELNEKGALLQHESITHSYPHCWRCKGPIIFRATEQWFMSIDHKDLRRSILKEIKKVKWHPAQGEERISSMVENRPDWCLSRQRYWGVPIPVFRCRQCKAWISDHRLIEHFADIVKDKGCDAWFDMPSAELLPADYKCPKCAKAGFEKGQDIIDVWFESGVSHQSVLKRRETLSYPADLYLEGSDQHRGWFQSALITSMAIDGRSAFRDVLTHGFVVDGEGRKMSKSLGNVISPQDIIKRYGADILRLWVASSDYNDDIRISGQILARLTEAYRKVRNTARFILGNLYDFDPEKDIVDYEEMLDIDRWAVSRVHSLLKDIEGYYDSFYFHKVYHALYTFCITDMSNFYLDILKDKLYTFKADSLERRSSQSAMYEIIKGIDKAIAPIMVFTAEEIWQNMPKTKEMPESVHLSLWTQQKDLKVDKALEARWQALMKIRDCVLKVLEEKRTSGIIGSSLEAKIAIYAQANDPYLLLKEYEDLLPEIFIVSQVTLTSGKSDSKDAFRDEALPDIYVVVDKADGNKCMRCWNYSLSVGSDKEHPKVCQRCKGVIEQIQGRLAK